MEIREGDALDTLEDVGGEVDLLLIDGAFALYLPVLRLVEPRLRTGAVILGENAFDPEYVGVCSRSRERLSVAAAPARRGPRQRVHGEDRMMLPIASPAGPAAEVLCRFSQALLQQRGQARSSRS